MTQLSQAVEDMMQLQPTLESLSSMIRCLRNAARQYLSEAAGKPEADEQVHQLLDRIALEMFRTRLSTEADQHDYDQAIIRNNYAISTQALGNDAAYVRGLKWLQWTGMRYGLLGLWTDNSDRAKLTVVGEYHQETQSPLHLDRAYSTATFPPKEMLGLATPETSHITMLLPIRTTRDWGVLAFVGAIEDRLLSGREGFGLWGTLLGAALEREDLHKSLIEQQRTLHDAYERERQLADTVRELGSPIIPLLPGVLLVPLIGVIDTNRAQHVLTDMLQAVETNRARHLFLDLTGVPIVDVSVANTLIQATRAVALLGAQTALVGIRPETAQSITALGVQLHHIKTYPSLAMAIQQLMAQPDSSARRFANGGQTNNRLPAAAIAPDASL
jgi:anti-anti-sigma regulatory factor